MKRTQIQLTEEQHRRLKRWADRLVLPLFRIRWVAEPLHRQATEDLLRRDRRCFSLVDTVSFFVMEADGIRDVMALDRDFEERGFTIVPGP